MQSLSGALWLAEGQGALNCVLLDRARGGAHMSACVSEPLSRWPADIIIRILKIYIRMFFYFLHSNEYPNMEYSLTALVHTNCNFTSNNLNVIQFQFKNIPTKHTCYSWPTRFQNCEVTNHASSASQHLDWQYTIFGSPRTTSHCAAVFRVGYYYYLLYFIWIVVKHWI